MTFEPSGVRDAVVAGAFYPASPEELRRTVERHLEAAGDTTELSGTVKAVIAPHAGYAYSGGIAGSAFRQLEARAPEIERVVLLGPAHFEPISGLALPDARAMATPLGSVPVDLELAWRVLELSQVAVRPAAHTREHSLEVELPFLQIVLGEFNVLPLAVGNATGEEIADVLEIAWGGPETVVVVSSDLSHYNSYETACELDRQTADSIVALDGPLPTQRACGAAPINGLLAAAARRGLSAQLLALCNSGDTAGGRDQVVGYGAFAFSAP